MPNIKSILLETKELQSWCRHCQLCRHFELMSPMTKEKIFCGLSTESFLAIILTVPAEISYKKVCNLTQVIVVIVIL